MESSLTRPTRAHPFAIPCSVVSRIDAMAICSGSCARAGVTETRSAAPRHAAPALYRLPVFTGDPAYEGTEYGSRTVTERVPVRQVASVYVA